MTERADGTRRIYRLDPRGLAAVRDWLEGFWAIALADFENFVNNQPEEDQ